MALYYPHLEEIMDNISASSEKWVIVDGTALCVFLDLEVPVLN